MCMNARANTRQLSIFRFSSGDLSSECDDVDPNDPSATGRAAPLQQQPMPNASGGPPNMPPPPAPARVAGLLLRQFTQS